MASERASQRAFFGVSALLFPASAAVTIVWCASMSAMGETPMPGGWRMSMAWMRMLGKTWSGAAASLLAMWVVMMVAMKHCQVDGHNARSSLDGRPRSDLSRHRSPHAKHRRNAFSACDG